MASVAPLIVITGPTASGKSAVAMELAQRYDGEIICADSRTIYKGMDIGTAKPSAEDRAKIPHHLLDVVEPGEAFSAADFKRLANEAIADIRARHKVPFLVGGTGLYIDSVVLDYTFTSQETNESQAKRRQELEDKTVQQLQELIKKQQLSMPENLKNKRHLVATLLRGNRHTERRSEPVENCVVVAIATEKDELFRRIELRAHEMFDGGVIEEAQGLGQTYGWESEAFTGVIYPILRQLVHGEISQEQAIDTFIRGDKQLVKKQLTWLRRHDFVQWFSREEAKQYLEQVLSSLEA